MPLSLCASVSPAAVVGVVDDDDDVAVVLLISSMVGLPMRARSSSSVSRRIW